MTNATGTAATGYSFDALESIQDYRQYFRYTLGQFAADFDIEQMADDAKSDGFPQDDDDSFWAWVAQYDVSEL